MVVKQSNMALCYSKRLYVYVTIENVVVKAKHIDCIVSNVVVSDYVIVCIGKAMYSKAYNLTGRKWHFIKNCLHRASNRALYVSKAMAQWKTYYIGQGNIKAYRAMLLYRQGNIKERQTALLVKSFFLLQARQGQGKKQCCHIAKTKG
jgi:hypothetical protein